ncbi:MAG: galactose oxidase, partial [Nitrospinae bacterium]|nr:galactose oxidase [Nitrospinota bacterium]
MKKSTLILLVLTLCLSLRTGPVLAEETGYWKSMPPAPTPRTEASAAPLDGKIYIVGGFTPTGIANKVEELDTRTGTWTERSPMPRPLHHTSVTAVGGKLYVIGGFSTGMWTPVNATYEYDPVKDSWTEKAHMPTA